jgi:cold shock protein
MKYAHYKSAVRNNAMPLPPSAKRATVKSFWSDRGYGFLIPADGGPDVFFHQTALKDPDCEPAPEDTARFVGGQRNGKPAACAVEII